jgi:cysteine synthase A
MIKNNISERIGKTPIIKLKSLAEDVHGEVFAKVEFLNPGGSVKDRIALSMVEDAEKSGTIKPGDLLIESTSGNTGIGLAMIAAAKGYRLILTMPDTMSMERRKILSGYGARLELTPGEKGMKGANLRAEELLKEYPGAFSPGQFKNPANPAAHEMNTGPEIIEDIKDMHIDAFIFCVGTGGTITGVGRALRKAGITAPIIAVEPSGSPVLSGGKPGPHKIQGIGAGFIPEVLDTALIDKVIQVDNDEAMIMARSIAANQGIFVGISSGAAAAASIKYLKEFSTAEKPLKVLTLFPSNGERYLSTELFADLV